MENVILKVQNYLIRRGTLSKECILNMPIMLQASLEDIKNGNYDFELTPEYILIW